MAFLGRNITRYPLRRTTLCAAPSTIVDDQTWTDIKNLIGESAEELWSPITLRNYESSTPDPVYGESLTKVWIDYTMYGFVNLQPSPKELTDMGIRDEINVIIKVLVTEIDRVLTPVNKKIDTDDRIIYKNVTYSVYKVGEGLQYKGNRLWLDVACKVYSEQSPRTVPG